MANVSDRSIEIVTVSLTYLTSIICIVSLPITIAILLILSANRSSTFHNAFFTFCKVGLLTDLVSILSIKLLITVPSLGWFVPIYTGYDGPKRVFYFLNWFLRTMQGFSNTFICINRATAILFPFVWSSKKFIRLLLAAQTIISCLSGFLNAKYDAVWRVYPSGRAFAVKVDNLEQRAHWQRGFKLILLSDIIMAILYTIMVVRFRQKLAKLKELTTENAQTINDSVTSKHHGENSQASSLLAIAGVVVSFELVYCIFYYRSYVELLMYQRDCRVYFTEYFIITDVYSLVLTYTLLIFSRPVRRQLRRVLGARPTPNNIGQIIVYDAHSKDLR